MATYGIINQAYDSLAHAYEKHGTEQWTRHEFYGILKEEVDELWDVIKSDGSTDDLIAEMSDIMAMILRYYDLGNRHSETL